MATAQDYIIFTGFNIVTISDDNFESEWPTSDIEGQFNYYYDYFLTPYYNHVDIVTPTDNYSGPEVALPLPYGGFTYDVGYAMNGEGGNDQLTGYTLPDWLVGGEGNDVLKGLGSRDILHGEQGNDKLYGGDDRDFLYGGSNNDSLYGGAGNDYLHAGSGDDWLNGGAGNDELIGGQGNDGYIIDAKSNDTIVEFADGGIDHVVVNRASYTLVANLENATVHTALNGGATLYGNGLANTLNGGIHADNLFGEAGADLLNGGNGNDSLYGGTQNDTVFGEAGADLLFGAEGDDYLDGGASGDVAYGGAGNDTYVIEDVADQVFESTNAGIDTVESLLASTALGANVENLKMLFTGQSYGLGNTLNNVINGSVWANTIDAGSGNDTVHGGIGNDTIYGMQGEDSLMGELGDDWVYGGVGSDTVSGDTGNDVLRGGDGTDRVYGGSGNDTIYGDGGFDLLYGDAGADVFVFTSTADAAMNGVDRIMDFDAREDLINLSIIDANLSLAGNQAFTFTGPKPFFASAGDLSVTTNTLGSLVEGDLNGDGISDFRFLVVGNYAMTAADFVL